MFNATFTASRIMVAVKNSPEYKAILRQQQDAEDDGNWNLIDELADAESELLDELVCKEITRQVPANRADAVLSAISRRMLVAA